MKAVSSSGGVRKKGHVSVEKDSFPACMAGSGVLDGSGGVGLGGRGVHLGFPKRTTWRVLIS